jgi:UDP-galactopyranose mutase
MIYDYLIVGAGLFGSVFAYEAKKRGKKCLVIDRRDHIGGNAYTRKIEGINVHKYGPHIFHTSKEEIWKYINKFAAFNNFINSPIAVYKDEIYNLPFNMNTFNKMWGVRTPKEAQEKILSQIADLNIVEPGNLEEQALALVGPDIYNILIKGYTEKQWGKACTDLPASIIKRLPVRFTYNNNYFNDYYQGIPIGGYTQIFESLLKDVEVKLQVDYKKFIANTHDSFRKIIYTGAIDEFYEYKFGRLEYRSLKFVEEIVQCDNFQGNAVVNYTDKGIPYTRIIEHKHFEYGKQPVTIITYEYPIDPKDTNELYYPMNDYINNELYKKYQELALKDKNIIFNGRLGSYKYYNMDNVIEEALKISEIELSK